MIVNWTEENTKIENYLNMLPDSSHKTIPEGILISAGSTHFISALLILKQLENLQNTLPIEFYFCDDELFPFQYDYIKTNFPNVSLFNCLDLIPKWFPWKIERKNIQGYMIKSFCMMVSKIKNIFFIDSDNIPFQKIEELFQNPHFIQYQNIFWPDVEFGTDEGKKLILPNGNQIYQLLNIQDPMDNHILPCESGQMIINTVYCWKAVCLSYYFNYFHPIYYSFFYGDKDIYYCAFQKTQTFYFLNSYRPFICNHQNHKYGILSSIFQRDPSSGKPILLHHTKSKISLKNKNFLKYIYPSHYPLLNEKNNLFDLYYDFNHHLNSTFVISIHKNINVHQLQNLVNIINLKFVNIIFIVFQEKLKTILEKMINTGKLFSNIQIIFTSLSEIPSVELKKNYYQSLKNNDINDFDEFIHQHISFDILKFIQSKQIKTSPYLIYFSLSKKNHDILHEPFFKISDSFIQPFHSKCSIFDKHLDIFLLHHDNVCKYQSLYHNFFIESKSFQDLDKLFLEKYSSHFTVYKNYICQPSELNLLHDHSFKYSHELPPYVISFYSNVYEPFMNQLESFYLDPCNKNILKDQYIQHIVKNKKNTYQQIQIEGKEYIHAIDQMNAFMDPFDPFFVNCQFEFELNQNNKNNISLLLDIIFKKNYHNMYTDIRETIYKYIINIYDIDDKFINFIPYFDDVYYFSLVVRLQCFYTITVKKLIDLLQIRKSNLFISDMIEVFENLKNHEKILIEKLDKVIDSLEKNQYGTLSFVRPFYFNQFYFLTYQNQNNCEVRKKVSQLHRLLFPSINYQIQNIKSNEETIIPPNHLVINKNRKKIGFISQFFKSHSVGRDRIGIIRGINFDLFDVHVFHLDKPEGDFYHEMCKHPELKNHYVNFSSIEEMRQFIENVHLDILVYADIGMIEESYLLAHSRLAPIQINTIGHSETSGIDTIDYYISSILSDNLEISQSHYSEKLLLTPSINTFYYRDFYNVYENSNIQIDYILPLESDKIYVSYLQNSLKAGEEDLHLLYQLLEKIPTVHLVLINLVQYTDEEEKLKTFLKPFFDQNRVILLGKLPTNHFYKLIQKSYLLLDAYPHGGCNTSLECFHFGKIMISRPSPYLRGRFTLGFYKKMNIDDCIVDSVDEYIEKVKYFVENPDKKLEVEEKIKSKAHLLFHDYQSIVDWNNIFLQLTQK